MFMNHLIGIDLGTQGTKASLRDESGKEIGTAFEDSRLIYPEVGAVEQDPEEMLGSVVRTMARVMRETGVPPGTVAGIAISGQMAGIMGVDAAGMAVTPYDSWLDTRCGKYRDRILAHGEDRVVSITGAPVTYAHGPKIVWWKHERPETYARIHKFVQPAAYCAMRLCGLGGGAAFIDHTYLHFAGFADTAKRVWSAELLSALDIDPGKMPAIVRPSDKIGGLSPEMAERCGLHAGTPMVAGCGDTASSIFGAGVIRPGLLLDVAGTASVLACAADAFVPDVKHKTVMFSNSVLDNIFVPYAYINGGGMCLKWFRDDILGGGADFRELDRRAAEVPAGSDGLLFLPHFSGRVCPHDTLGRGAYLPRRWKHGAAHRYRAILEGIAYEYGVYQDIIHELLPELAFERVFSVGGGSKGELFRRIKADVLGTEVSTINIVDTSLLACCAIAGYGVGLYASQTQLIEQSLRVGEAIKPDAARHTSYKPRQRIYADVFATQHDIIRRLHALDS
jgi:xylulokinase